MPIVKISSLQSYLTFPPSSLSQVSGPAAVALALPGASGQCLGAYVATPAWPGPGETRARAEWEPERCCYYCESLGFHKRVPFVVAAVL